MEIFDIIDGFTKDKNPNLLDNPEVEKQYNPYLINRWVSTTDIFLPLINLINKYDVDKKIHYKYLLNTLPQRKFYFKYPKQLKDNNKDVKKNISKYFECGSRDTECILEILNDNVIDELNTKYNYGGKE